jgi:transcriptional regulator with XRE-family HTH domain
MTKQKTKTAIRGRPVNDPGFAWVGLALRIRRLALGFTAVDIAEALGVSRSAVHSWEADTYPPSAKRVAELSALLKCRPRFFSRTPKLPNK